MPKQRQDLLCVYFHRRILLVVARHKEGTIDIYSIHWNICYLGVAWSLE